ncbi:MAG TPA: hypothetical protein VN249_01615, partial [Prolixibacteraceae bacterium]|nr:hypothetical protein [Prolixibacteraceae bacterium]
KEQSLQGDTIFYSRSAGTGMARSRVLLSDTTNHVAITGRKGIYNEKTKIAFVTDSAVFMQFSPKDTLYLHADTLKSIPDIAKKEAIKKAAGKIVAAKKSVPAKTDTTKFLPAKTDTTKSVPAKTDTTKFLPAKTDTTKSFTTKSDSAKTDTTKSAAAIPLVPAADTAKTFTVKSDTAKIIPAKKDSLLSPVDTTKVPAGIIQAVKENSAAIDSLATASDTLKSKDDKIFMAYHRVRFYKKDLQGICDSLSYQMKDSVMRLFKDPVLWSEVHQMTAERIEYRPHNPGPDIARLDNNGFIISREDSIKYNQISGKVLIGYIFNNALKTIEVNGNAITLYYLKNKDRYSGMNKLESSKINVYLLNSKIDSITFYPKPEGKTIPMKELTPEQAVLKGFQWRESEKPKTRFDIFPIEEKRKKIAGPDKKPATKKQEKSTL